MIRPIRVIAIAATMTLLGAISQHACGKSCEDDSIEDVSSSGEIIKMASGHIYEVSSVDTVDTALWLSADDVLVCDEGGSSVEIINTDESGEKASATRLR